MPQTNSFSNIKDEIEQISLITFTLILKSESKKPDYLNTLPELYAEALGYLNDGSVQNGMYIVIDIGGVLSTWPACINTCILMPTQTAISRKIPLA